MENKLRCQSCGMPVGPGYFGSNIDGSDNWEYCRFCFQKGEFTSSSLTVDKMIETSVGFMKNNLGFTEEKAQELSKNTIPHLKRWKTHLTD
ncbi:MAG: zinc ribbon domain-containing protein [Patescibacteria group bacterium]